MDSQKKDLKIDPLPLEREFSVLSIKRRLGTLSREELEDFLCDALVLMTKLAHQTQQLKDFIEEVE